MVAPKKKTKGRQKIELKKLVGSKQQVTFSKRRSGLFKKAGELCALCGAEVAIVVFSEKKGKPFCFGHPNVETVLNRYLNKKIFPESSERDVPVDECNRQHAEAQMEFEIMKKRKDEVMEEQKKKSAGNELGFWWDDPLDENMGLEELQHYLRALQVVRRKVAAKIDETMMMSCSSLMSPVDISRVGVGNHVGFKSESVNENWVVDERDTGCGFLGGHDLGFGYGQF